MNPWEIGGGKQGKEADKDSTVVVERESYTVCVYSYTQIQERERGPRSVQPYKYHYVCVQKGEEVVLISFWYEMRKIWGT